MAISHISVKKWSISSCWKLCVSAMSEFGNLRKIGKLHASCCLVCFRISREIPQLIFNNNICENIQYIVGFVFFPLWCHFFCNFEGWLWPHFASTAFNCLPWSIMYGAHRIDRYWPPTSGFLPKTNCEHRSFWCFHPSLNGLGYNNIHLNAINE